jgi:truncated hemoglobin YjbI
VTFYDKVRNDQSGDKVQMTLYDKAKIDQSGDKVQVTFYDKVKNSSIRGEKFR